MPFTNEGKQELVERVLASEPFRRAPAMRAFLLYITTQAQLGRTDQLKEQTIGVEVLGRKADYDPANDNIVRVRAHELRGRLMRYFASEGLNEPVVITIPRGGYAPEFLSRDASVLDNGSALPNTHVGNSRRLWWQAAAVCLIIAVSAFVLISKGRSRSAAQGASARSTGALQDFWAQFFSNRQSDLNVVYADASIALWQRLSGKNLNLGDYLSHKYLESPSNGELLEIVSQRATSPADMNTNLRLQTVAAEMSGKVNPQFARNINAEFLHQGNLVLIGSRRSNPWVEVYEPDLNFQLRLDTNTHVPFFLNRSPQPHESLSYAISLTEDRKGTANAEFIQQTEKKEFVSYGVVALLKGCGTNHLTVLLEGLNEQATQAAGDLVTDPQLLERLLERVGHTPGSAVSPFEALFQIMSLPGGYDDLQVVAYRLPSAESCIGN
jgi:hypothetical protein